MAQYATEMCGVVTVIHRQSDSHKSWVYQACTLTITILLGIFSVTRG